ncbi:dienelactone hydrolase family protein [Sphingopyxis chilensis]
MAAPIMAGRRELTVGSPGLDAILDVPPHARGVVIFAHGSGSGRFSPRNNHVAGKLREAGFATLLLDLLTAGEERDRRNIFDITLLAGRLRMARDWCEEYPATAALRPAYFGASTGAGAAMRAAANDPRIAAIISRGGRPDLAGASALAQVMAPTLLIVGGRDDLVIDLNREALAAMRCPRELAIVPGAGHLFEEPGALDRVVALAVGWLGRFLAEEPR